MAGRPFTIGVPPMDSNLSRTAAIVAIGVAVSAGLAGQVRTNPPQPIADRLSPIGVARPAPGVLAEKPAAPMPTVPRGLPGSLYAELQAPRMMVYAPNGDLFVSSPAANNITVL